MCDLDFGDMGYLVSNPNPVLVDVDEEGNVIVHLLENHKAAVCQHLQENQLLHTCIVRI